MPGKQNEEDEEKNEDDNNDWEDSWDGNNNKIILTSISKKNKKNSGVSDWEKSEVSDNVNTNTQLITHFTSNFIP